MQHLKWLWYKSIQYWLTVTEIHSLIQWPEFTGCYATDIQNQPKGSAHPSPPNKNMWYGTFFVDFVLTIWRHGMLQRCQTSSINIKILKNSINTSIATSHCLNSHNVLFVRFYSPIRMVLHISLPENLHFFKFIGKQGRSFGRIG